MRRACVLALAFVALLVTSPLLAGTQAQVTTAPTAVRFSATRFNDTLFANVDVAYRPAWDDEGRLWYATPAGLVRIDIANKTRHLFTTHDGLPSSLVLGFAILGGKVYAGTDLGLAVLDRATGEATALRTFNSGLLSDLVYEVVPEGGKLWIGTRFGGAALFDPATSAWTTYNTSTTPDYPHTVRRILPTPEAVWFGTDGDGLWRLDRATGNLTTFVIQDGLPSNTILGLAERDGKVYVGTDEGLVEWGATGKLRHWNTTSGMPDDTVWDVDFIPTADGGADLFAATSQGVWQLNLLTGAFATLDQGFGILGSLVFENVYDDARGWAIATDRGISLATETGWQYFTTGPTNGPSSGPVSYRFTAVESNGPFVWAGADNGVSAFQPATTGERGVWYNLGGWQSYPGGPVNHIRTYGNTTWLATNFGVYGWDMEAGAWVHKTVSGARNVAYGLDADQGELWVGLFGEGLIMENLTTGVERNWTYASTPSPIPDQHVTDVRIAGDDVWLGMSIGVARMDRILGTFKAVYTSAEGIPGDGVVFRTLPDGPSLWVGTKTGGVARLDVLTGQVTRVWNATTAPGFPDDEVRALHREGGRLWVGTKEGLARINISSGEATWWNQSHSKLVQQFVNGIASRDGLLYLATSSGVQRFDIATETFLPMIDGASGQRVTPNASTAPAQTPIGVRIDAPRDGTGVTGLVEVRGVAHRLGGTIEKVEVRIGQGPWQLANGTDFWNFTWDSTASPANEPIAISARARSAGEVSREADVLVTPVALPRTPLSIEHHPARAANAGRGILLVAKVQGDDPLTASAYYRPAGALSFSKLDLQRQGGLFTGTIPPRDVVEGPLEYYIDARSGILSVTSPGDLSEKHVVAVGPAPRLAVSLEGPARVDAKAGEATRVSLRVTNVGTEPATYVVTATGLRASWVAVPADPIALAPGASQDVPATIAVPLQAFADETTLKFAVRDVDGLAEPSEASVPLRVVAADIVTSTPPTRNDTPIGLAPLAGLALAALALRRRPT